MPQQEGYLFLFLPGHKSIRYRHKTTPNISRFFTDKFHPEQISVPTILHGEPSGKKTDPICCLLRVAQCNGTAAQKSY